MKSGMESMTIAGVAVEQFVILPISVVAFLILLAIIVFFHEYGHFSVARLLGVRVDVFSLGFGKTIARWVDRKGTEWRISLIPLGGYVKFFGDANAASQPDSKVKREPASGKPATTQFPRPGHEEEVAQALSPEERKVCFHFKPVWVRTAVVAAGPVANLILAIGIFWVLLMGFGELIREPRVGSVVEGSAAAEAGFEAGDKILTINGREIRRFEELALAARLGTGERLVFTVERAGETVVLEATPRREETEDAFGNKIMTGRLGIGEDPKARTLVRYGPLGALRAATGEVGGILSATVRFLGRLILGKEDTRQLGGPIKMAQYAGQSVMSGFDESGYEEAPDFLTKLKVSLVAFINLAAVVSVSIGFLNLLPVPVLDGGHLMYYAYEAVAGRPLGARAQGFGFRVGIVLLASLMLLVTWNDIASLFSFNN